MPNGSLAFTAFKQSVRAGLDCNNPSGSTTRPSFVTTAPCLRLKALQSRSHGSQVDAPFLQGGAGNCEAAEGCPVTGEGLEGTSCKINPAAPMNPPNTSAAIDNEMEQYLGTRTPVAMS